MKNKWKETKYENTILTKDPKAYCNKYIEPFTKIILQD